MARKVGVIQGVFDAQFAMIIVIISKSNSVISRCNKTQLLHNYYELYLSLIIDYNWTSVGDVDFKRLFGLQDISEALFGLVPWASFRLGKYTTLTGLISVSEWKKKRKDLFTSTEKNCGFKF